MRLKTKTYADGHQNFTFISRTGFPQPELDVTSFPKVKNTTDGLFVEWMTGWVDGCILEHMNA